MCRSLKSWILKHPSPVARRPDRPLKGLTSSFSPSIHNKREVFGRDLTSYALYSTLCMECKD